MNNGQLKGVVRRSDTDLFDVSERDSFGTSNPYRLRLMSLLGVRYILESKKGELKDTNTDANRFPADLFKTVWQDGTWRIWEYVKAYPRVIFADSYIVSSSDQETIDAIYDTSIDLTHTVILEKEPSEKIRTSDDDSTARNVRIVRYSMNSVTVSSDSGSDGFVVLSDTYYPGWHATVDGRKASIYRADYALRAVFVPKGQHKIVFNYLPDSFLLGLGISVIGVLLLVVYIFRFRK